jgi:hypothetical protein
VILPASPQTQSLPQPPPSPHARQSSTSAQTESLQTTEATVSPRISSPQVIPRHPAISEWLVRPWDQQTMRLPRLTTPLAEVQADTQEKHDRDTLKHWFKDLTKFGSDLESYRRATAVSRAAAAAEVAENRLRGKQKANGTDLPPFPRLGGGRM